MAKYQASQCLLQAAGLRPTRQRLAVAAGLFDGTNKHVTVEQVQAMASKSKTGISLATVYNTLNAFRKAGLLRSFAIDAGQTIFDTNTEEHFHVFDEQNGKLKDVSMQDIHISNMPSLPSGKSLARVDIVVRIR